MQDWQYMGIDGPWKLTVSSSVAEGVYEAEFGFAQRAVTPHLEGCGFLWPETMWRRKLSRLAKRKRSRSWLPNLGVYPSADCSADYDIVTVKVTRCSSGNVQDNNMCSADKRPQLVQYLRKRSNTATATFPSSRRTQCALLLVKTNPTRTRI